MRGGETRTITAQIGNRPDQRVASNDPASNDDSQTDGGQAGAAQAMGLGLASVTPEARRNFNIDQSIDGVLVTGSIRTAMPATRASSRVTLSCRWRTSRCTHPTTFCNWLPPALQWPPHGTSSRRHARRHPLCRGRYRTGLSICVPAAATFARPAPRAGRVASPRHCCRCGPILRMNFGRRNSDANSRR